jgi:hypothetical protein
MNAPRPQTIPVFLVIRSAYQLLWQRKDDALRLGFVPTLLCFGGLFYSDDVVRAAARQASAGMSPEEALAGYAGMLIVSSVVVLLAIMLLMANWMRFMLLGPMGAVGIGLNIGRPHLAFAIAIIVMAFAAGIALLVLSMPLLLLPEAFKSIGVIVCFIALYIGFARLLPFAVGQAIGQPVSLQESWRAARGNGIALAVSLVLVQVPLWLAALATTFILNGVGFAAAAPLAMIFIGAVFQCVSAILQASVLATAFRQLIGIRA